MPSAVSPWRRWKRLTARLVLRAVDAVGVQPEQPLDERDARALGALLERTRGGGRRRAEHERQQRHDEE